jgi:type II secretory pathway component PulF
MTGSFSSLKPQLQYTFIGLIHFLQTWWWFISSCLLLIYYLPIPLDHKLYRGRKCDFLVLCCTT